MAQGRSKKAPPPGHDIHVPVDWRPRPYQQACWKAFAEDGVKRGVCVWHRRAGKDHLAINLCAVSMFKRPGIYWHVLPTYTQGKKAIWNGMDNDGRKFIDYIPKEAAMRRRNDDMIIEFEEALGGSIYQVIGGDNPDRIVGGNPIGVVFSEYSLMNPNAWDLIRPILNANDGWALFIFTPRGYNHGHDIWKAAQESEHWFTEMLDITQTHKHNGDPVMTQAMVDEDIRLGMPEELARQEYFCDFSAPLVGAYFGKEMDDAESEGRISPDVKWRKEFPVSTCWDLGVRDTMVVWFYQVIDEWVHWIDYHAASGSGIDDFARVLDRKPYVYKDHYAPHDVAKREVGYGKSIMATAADLGIRFSMVPRTRNLDDDINAVRLLLPRSRFNSETCEHGIKALRHYSKKWDTTNKVWSLRPEHSWASHPVDAMRTGAVVMPRLVMSLKTPAKFPGNETWNELMADHDDIIAAEGCKSSFKRI